MRTRGLGAALAMALLGLGCGKSGGEQGQSAASQSTPAAQVAAQPGAATSQGQAVFQRVCATCHQLNAQGLPGAFPPLAGSPFAAGPAERMIRIVLNGLMGPVEVKGQRFNNVMPPWKTLSDAEISAVLTYVRSNFGNTASAVTAEQVAQVRAATASRTTMWTVTELER
ncbi:MAG: cytochrome c [Acidobacteriia bacterium]|nr:cytochrome c [Terriglobia bacterium]